MNFDKKTGSDSFTNNAYILMAILLFLWGSFAAVSKLVLGRIDSFQMQFYMFGFASLIMTVVLIFTGKIKEMKTLRKKDFIGLFIYSFPSFLYYFLYSMSLKLIPAVEASMLNYLFPILIVLFAVPINGEKLDMLKIISLVMGFAGVLIIFTNGSFGNIKVSNLFGDALALGAAVSWGIFSNLLKRNRLDTVLSNYIFTITSFLLSTICMFTFSRFTLPDLPSATGILWLGLSNIVLTYYIWTKALKISSSALVASMSFLTPFVNLLFIVVLLEEKISLYHMLGLLVIIVGIILQNARALFVNRIIQLINKF